MVKRIAVLTDHSDPLAPLGGMEAGGENVYVLELTRALARRGWVIDVFTRWASPKTSRVAKVMGNVRVIRLKAGPVEHVTRDELFPFMPEYVQSFLNFQRENNLEYFLIHGNYYFSAWAGISIGRTLKIPAVATFHSLGSWRQQALGTRDTSPTQRMKIEKEVMEGVDKVIATSPQMKEEMQKSYEVNAKKITVIPGGVNLKRFTPIAQHLARRIVGINPNRMIVLYVGRIERRKGIDTLLSSMHELAKRMPDKRKILRLYITGGEPRRRWKEGKNDVEKVERERLLGIVEKLGIKDIVRFLGGVNRENLPFYYAASDVTVVPSYYEPFGLVPLESMACGTPVIASRVGGMQWTIKDGKTGILVKPKDPLAFAHEIKRVFDNPTLKKHMRENGIERVRKLFSWDEVAHQMSYFYNDLIIEYFWRQVKGNNKQNIAKIYY